MRVFRPVVRMASHLAAMFVAEFAHGSGVRSKPVGDDGFSATLALQRLAPEAQSLRFIAGFGDKALQHLALVIHGAPEVMHLAVDLHVDLIEMPPPVPEAFHPADPLAPDIGSEHRAEPVPPQPHGLVADIDAAFEQEVFDVPQREREPHVHHHHKADHLGRGVEIPERIVTGPH